MQKLSVLFLIIYGRIRYGNPNHPCSDIEELRIDLDKWIIEYNNERTHIGKYCF